MADAQDGGYDIYLITSGQGRLLALNIDLIGDFDPAPPPADDELPATYYRLEYDADADGGAYQFVFGDAPDNATDPLTPGADAAAIDAALEELDGIDSAEVISGGAGDFLIAITATEDYALGLPPEGIAVLEQIDYLIA